MAIQDARDFVEKAAGDEGLREDIRARWDDIENLGHDHGHQFNRDEFLEAMHERAGEGEGADPAAGPHTCTCI